MTDRLDAPRQPCAECPWRRDVETGRFPVERFEALAGTSYDMSVRIFQCHKTSDGKPLVCAGFLERGASHNMAIRLAYGSERLEKLDRSGGYPLYDSYREMALANGVSPDAHVLDRCRDDG